MQPPLPHHAAQYTLVGLHIPSRSVDIGKKCPSPDLTCPHTQGGAQCQGWGSRMQPGCQGLPRRLLGNSLACDFGHSLKLPCFNDTTLGLVSLDGFCRAVCSHSYLQTVFKMLSVSLAWFMFTVCSVSERCIYQNQEEHIRISKEVYHGCEWIYGHVGTQSRITQDSSYIVF